MATQKPSPSSTTVDFAVATISLFPFSRSEHCCLHDAASLYRSNLSLPSLSQRHHLPYHCCCRSSPLVVHVVAIDIVIAFFSTRTSSVAIPPAASSASPSAFALPQNIASSPSSLASHCFLTRSNYFPAMTLPLPSTLAMPSYSSVPNHILVPHPLVISISRHSFLAYMISLFPFTECHMMLFGHSIVVPMLLLPYHCHLYCPPSLLSDHSSTTTIVTFSHRHRLSAVGSNDLSP
ncbi:hypothetical protein BHE74_00025673 [Ensete ventricosum]|nr:hypothetical protein BHE74_00025673 [Ensete ventricosum]